MASGRKTDRFEPAADAAADRTLGARTRAQDPAQNEAASADAGSARRDPSAAPPATGPARGADPVAPPATVAAPAANPRPAPDAPPDPPPPPAAAPDSASAAARLASTAAPHPVVAGRYELGELLGRGGAGRVHAARDRVSGARVAVKLLDAATPAASVRVHREISALRLLRLPGVVTLLDEGVHDGARFLVMDLVPGRPFPGRATPAAWDALAPLVLSLFEVLSRVHAAGVLHRDLKPSNVFVDGDGRVTVLDFGISFGPALGEAVTSVGAVVGTPEYLAPEQFVGAAADVRTDLYAATIMVYEALTGRPPHEARDFMELVALKRSRAPTPVRVLAPDAPRDVADAIDQLLAMDPDDRPQSAAEAIQALFGGRPLAAAARALPRLGAPEPLERVVAAALSGRSIDVVGPAGSGRTRLLSDASDLLTRRGRDVRWMAPGSEPYASVAPVVGPLDDLRDVPRETAVREIDARIRRHLLAGGAILADDWERLDRWSASAVDRCRDAGAVVRVTARPAEPADPAPVRIAPLTESDLRPLFAGPDRIFHLREDGARELWRRTGGLPSRVAAELAAWVRAGLGHWQEGRLAVRRETLDRLRGGQPVGDELQLAPGDGAASKHLDELLAWVVFATPHATPELLAAATGRPRFTLEPALDALVDEGLARRLDDGSVQPLAVPRALHTWSADQRRAVHRALSSALPPGTPMRIRHLAAAGAPEEVADEALAVAPELNRLGHAADALVVLEEGLAAARSCADRGVREPRVLAEFAKVCLAQATPQAVDRALYELSRAADRPAAIRSIEALLRAARAVGEGDPAAALAMLDGIAPFDDEDLELWRHGQRFRAARSLGAPRAAVVLADAEAWAERSGRPRARMSVDSWRALLLARERRHEEAARLHLSVAERGERVTGRLASYLNAAISFHACLRIDEARDAALRVRDLAAACRHSVYESHAESLLRALDYVQEMDLGPDLELVEAVAALGEPRVLAPLLLTEAAAAWRAGRNDVVLALTDRAMRIWERASDRPTFLQCRALSILCGGACDAGEPERLAREAEALPDARLAVEVLGVLALGSPAPAAEGLRAAAARRAGEIPSQDRERRGEILSIREALEGCPSS